MQTDDDVLEFEDSVNYRFLKILKILGKTVNDTDTFIKDMLKPKKKQLKEQQLKRKHLDECDDEELENVLITVVEMFLQRGYKKVKKKQKTIVGYEKVKGKKNKVCAFAYIIEKLDINEIKHHFTKIKELGLKHAILIYRGSPTSSVKNVIIDAKNMGITIEIIPVIDIINNPTKHELVPKHTRVTGKELKNVKKFIGKDINRLPKIFTSDPISRFLFFKKGDIILVNRPDEPPAYLLCIEE